MDFWNRQKVKELELKIGFKEKEIEVLKDKLRLAEKKIKGERVCGGYCQKCVHGIERIENMGFMGGYTCELDCKCKDFQKKEIKERV